MTSTRRLVSFIALAVLAGSLAACGTASGPAENAAPKLVVVDPAMRLAASAGATTAASTARLTATMTMTADQLPKPVSISMAGVTALDGSRGDLRMDMSSMLGMIPGAPAKLMVEVRLVDGALYMNFGDMFAALSQGKPLPPSLAGIKWLKLDLSQLQAGQLGGTGSSPASFTQYLEYLRGASSGHVLTLGHETVGGVSTTHYSALIDKAKLVDQINKVRAHLSPELRTMIDRGLPSLSDGISIDVWIGDHDGLVHKMSTVMRINVGAVSTTMMMTEQLDDFGVALDVHAPAPDQVKSLADLMGAATGTGSA